MNPESSPYISWQLSFPPLRTIHPLVGSPTNYFRVAGVSLGLGARFRVQGLGISVQGLGFRDEGLGFRD